MVDSFQTIVTRQGAALIAAAATEGTAFRLVTLVAGSRDAAPDEAATSVPDEVWRGPIIGVTAGADEGTAVIDAAIPLEEGGWTIRQLGVLDADDNLILHASVPETLKPTRAAGAIRDLAYRIVVRFTNAETVNLLIDPHIVTATRHWTESFVGEAIAAHDADPAAHANRQAIAHASTTVVGITRYATDAEAAEGVIDDAALTPAAARALTGDVNGALADLALRHALEQPAATIIGPRYEGRDFPTPNGASASAGWRHAPGSALWHSGRDETEIAGPATWTAGSWSGDLDDGTVAGGPGTDQTIALADTAGDWDLSWDCAAWAPPAPGAATHASGQVRITVPEQVTQHYIRPAYTDYSGGDNSHGRHYAARRWSEVTVTVFRLRLRTTAGVVLGEMDVDNANGAIQIVHARAADPGPGGNLPNGTVFQVTVVRRTSRLGARRGYPAWHYALGAPAVQRLSRTGGGEDFSATAASAFTGGADEALATQLNLTWNDDSFAAVVFGGPPDRGIAVRTAASGDPATLDRVYLGRRFRLRRRGTSLALHDIGAVGAEDDATPVAIGEWTVAALARVTIGVARYADGLRWQNVTLFRPGAALRAAAGALTVRLAAPDATPARLVWAARADPAQSWSGLTAAVSRDGGTTWIDATLDFIRADADGRAILAGAAAWPADSPPGRDLALRFTKSANQTHAIAAIGVHVGG